MPTKEGIEATCPECRGPLSTVKTDDLLEIRCLVGHAYTARGLLRAHSEAEEKALWSAVVALRETASIIDALSDILRADEDDRLRAQVHTKLYQAGAIEEIIRQLEPFEV